LLAELAQRNFKLVFSEEESDGENEVMMPVNAAKGPVAIVLEVFAMLKGRVEWCEEHRKAVREDDLALTYMETVNKYRDIFEVEKINNTSREAILTYVLQFMHQ
jgi:hypothetical protein